MPVGIGEARPHRRDATVLVLGGSGFYGRYLVNELLAWTAARVIVASRSVRFDSNSNRRVTSLVCDIRHPDRLAAAVGLADIVAHCAGPFLDLPMLPLDIAISLRRPYIDIAEDRAFASEVALRGPAASTAGVPVLSGMSVSPAMEAIATEYLSRDLQERVSLTTFAAPDTRRHRGKAMFDTMLAGAGRAFDQPTCGGTRRASGWTNGMWFEFPPPVGRRLTYLIHDMADIDLLPADHGVAQVSFRAGSEFAWLNRGVSMAALARNRLRMPDWRWASGPVRALSRVVGTFGRDEGAVAFDLAGKDEGGEVGRSMAISVRRDGGRIPILPAAMAIEEVMAGRLTAGGRHGLAGWIEPDRFLATAATRGFELWKRRDAGDPWVPMDAHCTQRSGR